MILTGFIGYLFLKFDLPMAPIALALVLTAPLETAIRQSFTISNGSPAIFVTRPIALALFLVGAIFICLPIVLSLIKNKGDRKNGTLEN